MTSFWQVLSVCIQVIKTIIKLRYKVAVEGLYKAGAAPWCKPGTHKLPELALVALSSNIASTLGMEPQVECHLPHKAFQNAFQWLRVRFKTKTMNQRT